MTTPVRGIVLGLIAPCGMNCGLCIGHLRAERKCPGCRGNHADKPRHCVHCSIINCPELKKSKSKYCFACEKYPCRRLRQLDQRYRLRYRMSMLDNLAFIRDQGIRAFVARERKKWKCPACGQVLCVHRGQCPDCGKAY
ncbi:DUF3795 domain-containing protein [candidate division FCPU426 bacterium]|nr:DUF3795 domain-containing protein [candidate division FCPU426 bacterium]